MDQIEEKILLKKFQLKCKIHTQKQVSYVCISDNCSQRLICSSCVKESSHKNHRFYFYMLKEFIDESLLDSLLKNVFNAEQYDLTSLLKKLEDIIKLITEKIMGFQKIILDKLYEQNSIYNQTKEQVLKSQVDLMDQLIQNKPYDEVSQTINNILRLKEGFEKKENFDITIIDFVQADIQNSLEKIQDTISNKRNLLSCFEPRFQNSLQNQYQPFVQLVSQKQLQLRLDNSQQKSIYVQGSNEQTIFLDYLFNKNQKYSIKFKIGLKQINQFQQRSLFESSPIQISGESFSNKSQKSQFDDKSQSQLLGNKLKSGLLKDNNQEQKGGQFGQISEQQGRLLGNSLQLQQQQQLLGQNQLQLDLYDRLIQENIYPENNQIVFTNNQPQSLLPYNQFFVENQQGENINQQQMVNQEIPILLMEQISNHNQSINDKKKSYHYQGLKLLITDTNRNIISQIKIFNENQRQNLYAPSKIQKTLIKEKDTVQLSIDMNKIEIIISPDKLKIQETLNFQDIPQYNIGFAICFYIIDYNKINSNQNTITGPIITVDEIQQIY